MIAFSRPNAFEIDLDVIAANAGAIRRMIGRSVRFFAVLKADAYGFGALAVAQTVLRSGADSLALVDMETSIALRNAGIGCPILLYPGQDFDRAAVECIERMQFIPTIHSRASFQALQRYAIGPLPCAIKLAVGQERLGIPAEEAAAFIFEVSSSRNLSVAMVNTHPHVLDGAADHLEWQFKRFVAACDEAEQRGVRIPLRMFASSRVLPFGPTMHLSAVDPGRALFWSCDTASGDQTATPFKALRAQLLQIFRVRRDQHIDRLPNGITPGMRIGIASMGNSDGLGRLNAGHALVRGEKVKILRPLSLEYCRLDLSELPTVCVGDEVVFIGEQGGARISLEDVVAATGAFRASDLPFEVRASVPRRYSEGHRSTGTKEADDIKYSATG